MYVIIGANGFLGQYLIKNLLEKTSDGILATDIVVPENEINPLIKWTKCDITAIEDLQNLNNEICQTQDIKIIFLAAYHNPDLVMKNPKIAWNVNVIALANFLNIIDNIKMLYYPSTEVVYGQGKEKFAENAPLNPVSRYGELKTIAERMVSVAGYNIVRFPVLMGPSLVPNKKHFFDIIIETLESNQKIEMFVDQKRSMIDFDTASKIVIDLMENDDAQKYKIVNISGDENLSKYELALKIADKYNLEKSNIIPIEMNAQKSIFTEKRALETLLDNTLVKNILAVEQLKIKV